MSHNIVYQVDSFTKTPFKGNPAGVSVLDRKMSDQNMQNIAKEMNLSETAFLEKRSENEYGIRFFTPTTEIDLCGHASLASAHILWERYHVASSEIVFYAREQTLRIWRKEDQIQMSFPAISSVSVDKKLLFESILSVPVVDVRESANKTLVILEDEEVFTKIKPDIQKIKEHTKIGLVVTSPSSDPQYDFVSRTFVPNVGIDEDPVTGVAHCVLTPYWSQKLSKRNLSAFQASRRTGFMDTELDGDRVILKGYAVTVMECKILIEWS